MNPAAAERETYRASLMLDKGERLHLFDFSGHADTGTLIGAKDFNPLTQSYRGDPTFEQGHELAARGFVDSLCELLGVGLGEPVAAVKDSSGRTWSCGSCSRTGPPRDIPCQYCGGPMAASTLVSQ